MNILIVSIWGGILTLPFLGMKYASLISLALLAGVLLFQYGLKLSSKVNVSFIEDIKEGITVSCSNIPYDYLYPLIFIPAVITPLFLNNYYIDVLILIGIYIVLASGLNIVVGFAGLLDLGYIAFYGIGAYAYALLSTKFGISFWAGIPLGGIFAAIFGILLGVITLRLRGDYLAIVTLGFLHIVHLVMNNWDSLTNGPNGILNIAPPEVLGFVFREPLHFYYLILLIAIVAVFIVHRLKASRVGRGWIAIREDEIAAAAMGINITHMKIIAFALGAAFAGIAGVFFSAKFAFVSPESFTFAETVIVLSMVVIGGMGSVSGVVFGAAAVIILPELLRGFQSYRMIIFGAILIAITIFRVQREGVKH